MAKRDCGLTPTNEAYHKLVASKMGTRERGNLSRALTRVASAHREELHTARTTSAEALVAMRLFGSETALMQRTAAAAGAKHAFQLEELRARLARAERLLTEKTDAAAAALHTASGNAARADVNAATLCAEIRRLEFGRGLVGDMLADERRSSAYMEEEGGLLRLQTRRAGTLLQEQGTAMAALRAKLATAQRRAQKLGDLQQAAHAWTIERARLREQLAAQERATEAALAGAAAVESGARRVAAELAQELDAARDAASRAQQADSSVRAELLTLRECWSRLVTDKAAVVSLGAGAGVTLAEFATNVQHRVAKRVHAGTLFS